MILIFAFISKLYLLRFYIRFDETMHDKLDLPLKNAGKMHRAPSTDGLSFYFDSLLGTFIQWTLANQVCASVGVLEDGDQSSLETLLASAEAEGSSSSSQEYSFHLAISRASASASAHSVPASSDSCSPHPLLPSVAPPSSFPSPRPRPRGAQSGPRPRPPPPGRSPPPHSPLKKGEGDGGY